jgi:hypothetical protein
MLGFDLQFARDALTLCCTTCGQEREVDRTRSPEEVAAATVGFCDTHVPCSGDVAIPTPRPADADQMPRGTLITE